MVGEKISHYRVLEKLGEGGMGQVYLAEDTRLGRKVAIKALPAQLGQDAQRVKRFQQEARAVAALNHPGIAAIFELEEVEGRLYIVFEYVEGETLRSRIIPGGLELKEFLAIATALAQALDAAHAKGVVHRDLKPENVMRTPDGHTKILDFGLARIVTAPSEDANTRSLLTTTPGMVMGTIAYMSPEQLEGKEVDFRSDIFSFGVMLYELAAGIRPFDGGSTPSTIARILSEEPLPLARHNALSPAELERIMRKCLRKKPEQRYQSTRELLVDLENLGEDSQARHTAPSAIPLEDSNLFRPWFQKVIPTPRRWWELSLLFALGIYAVLPYVAWKARQASTQYWAPLAFAAMVVCVIVPAVLRLILLETAAVLPAELPERVRRFATAIRAFTFSHAALLILMAPELGAEKYPIGAPLVVAWGLATAIYAFNFEPWLERAAFPEAFASASLKGAKSAIRPGTQLGWWYVHNLATIFVLAPFVFYCIWLAKPAIPVGLRQPLFLLEVLAISLVFGLRFVLLNVAVWNLNQLRAEHLRLRPYVRVASWVIVAGLLVIAGSILSANEWMAAVLGFWGMGGLVSILFIEPAVERQAFPGPP